MKKRPNPLKQRGLKFTSPRKRTRRPIRQPLISVYAVTCKACKQNYELQPFSGQPISELKFCIFCKSDQTEIKTRLRKETRAEREQRNMENTLRMASMVGRLFSGLFGFNAPPPGSYPAPARNGKPQSDLEAELLREGYRKLAQKYHPDKGGDPEKMKELNRLKEKMGL